MQLFSALFLARLSRLAGMVKPSPFGTKDLYFPNGPGVGLAYGLERRGCTTAWRLAGPVQVPASRGKRSHASREAGGSQVRQR